MLDLHAVRRQHARVKKTPEGSALKVHEDVREHLQANVNLAPGAQKPLGQCVESAKERHAHEE